MSIKQIPINKGNYSMDTPEREARFHRYLAEGWEDEGTAWRDFGVSEASAELSIWTHPTRAYNDYEEYRSKFDGTPAAMAPSTLRFAASPRGLGLVWRF